MGVTCAGIVALRAPGSDAASLSAVSFLADLSAVFFVPAVFVERPRVEGAVAFFVVFAAARFFRASFTQSFFVGAAGRLLCHSADPSSPAISSSDRLVSTDQSCSAAFASYPGMTDSSCFLINSHSLSLPYRPLFIFARTKPPFSLLPCSVNLKSPLAYIAVAARSKSALECFFALGFGSAGAFFEASQSRIGSHVPVSHPSTVPAP